MKSIVQEASSIEKAIQRAWLEAGSPAEFSVRILEHPVRKFFGLFIKRSAKVALVFPGEGKTEQKNSTHERSPKKGIERKPQQKQKQPAAPIQQAQPQRPRTQSKQTPGKRVLPSETASSLTQALAPKAHPQEEKVATKPHATEKRESLSSRPQPELIVEQKTRQETDPAKEQSGWNTDLVTAVEKQLGVLIPIIRSTECPYTLSTKGRELFVTFARPVLESKEQDRRLFGGMSPLLMTIVKREFKKALRGYRIILGHAE